MSEKHAATYHGSDLQRRRELADMSKIELIDHILNVEARMRQFTAQVDAYWDET